MMGQLQTSCKDLIETLLSQHAGKDYTSMWVETVTVCMQTERHIVVPCSRNAFGTCLAWDALPEQLGLGFTVGRYIDR